MNEVNQIGISVKQAAAALGVGRNTIINCMGRNDFTSYKIGKRRIIDKQSFHNFIDAKRNGGAENGTA
ncbi:MAG: helix-turn-helix domain-containing protein [Shewanella sp.]